MTILSTCSRKNQAYNNIPEGIQGAFGDICIKRIPSVTLKKYHKSSDSNDDGRKDRTDDKSDSKIVYESHKKTPFLLIIYINTANIRIKGLTLPFFMCYSDIVKQKTILEGRP